MQNKLKKFASRPFLIAGAAVLLFAGVGSYLLASSNAQAPPPATPAQPSLLKPYSVGTAPYQYIAYSGSVEQTRAATGISQYFAAFIVSSPTACTPAWGGSETNGLTSQRANDIAADFTSLRAAGGEVAVSFGGSHGAELATTCPTVADLSAAYGSVIDKYKLTRVDFDIEGPALLDDAANMRRADAIANLRQAHPDLKVWVTLPVDGRGLTQSGQAIIQQLRDRDVALNGVNIMAMNYNIASKNMGQQAITTAKESFSQLKKLYVGTADADIWKALGITVMIGRNDTVPETFSLADARTVHAFAAANKIGMLSIWNAGRDVACPPAAAGVPATTAPSIACSDVPQQPYDFLKALTIPAVR